MAQRSHIFCPPCHCPIDDMFIFVRVGRLICRRSRLSLSLSSLLPALLQFVEWSSCPIGSTPTGSLVVLGNSTVAVVCSEAIEVYDWAKSKRLHSFPSAGKDEFIDRTSDGRLIVAAMTGVFKIGHVAKWEAATVLAPDSKPRVWRLVATQDGSFVTSEQGGKVTIWRDGKATAIFDGGPVNRKLASPPLAIVGSRIVSASATDDTILVIEQE